MATEIEQLFIRIGAITRGFDDAMNRVEKKAKDADTKLAINPKVNPQSLKSLNAEMDRLKGRAAELRGNLLTIKPTVDNPNAVKDLEHELAKVESRMQLVGKAADDLKDRIGRIKDSGDKIAGIGRSLSIGITLPIIAAGTAVAVLAGKTGEYAEEIANLSQSTGISARNLQVLKFIADNAGLSFENVTTAAGMVQQKLMGVEDDSGNAAKAFERLGIGIYDAQGNLKSMDTLFPELIKKLQGMSNQTERNMLAAQVFGRGWRELAPILGMTAAEMDAAAKRAEELGIVMSDEALESAQEFDDAIDDLKQQATGLARGLVSDLIPTLKNELIPALVDILKWGGSVLKWFMSLPDPVKKLGLGVILLTAAFGPLLSMFGNGISLLAQLKLATMAAGLGIGAAGTSAGAATVTFAGLAGTMGMSIGIIAAVAGAVWDLSLAWGAVTNAYDAYIASYFRDKKVNERAEKYIATGDHSIKKMEIERGKAEELARVKARMAEAEARDKADQEAADKRRHEMNLKYLSDIAKIEEERRTELKGATGPKHKAVINEDYDRQVKKLRSDFATEMNKENEKFRQSLADSRKAIADAAAERLDIEGRTYEAATAMAANRYRAEMGELQALAAVREKEFNAQRKRIADAYADETQYMNRKDAKKVHDAYQPMVNAWKGAKSSSDEDIANRQLAIVQGYQNAVTRAYQAEANRRAGIYEQEVDAYNQAQADKLRIGGKDYLAEMREAANVRDKAMRDLGRLQQQGERPEQQAARKLAIDTNYYKSIGEISAKFYKEQEALRKDNERKELDALKVKETANLSMWERITEVLNNYSDRLTGALYGESAVRIQQLERSRAAEVKYLEENIKDEETKASTIAALNADYDMQKNDIHAEDERRYQEQMSWWQSLKQSVDFSSAEGLWKRMAGTPSLAFAGPSVNQSFAGPSLNLNGGMGLGQVATLQQKAITEQQEGNRRLRKIEERLTPK
jgi:hypothetical protein